MKHFHAHKNTLLTCFLSHKKVISNTFIHSCKFYNNINPLPLLGRPSELFALDSRNKSLCMRLTSTMHATYRLHSLLLWTGHPNIITIFVFATAVLLSLKCIQPGFLLYTFFALSLRISQSTVFNPLIPVTTVPRSLSLRFMLFILRAFTHLNVCLSERLSKFYISMILIQ